MGKFIGDPGEQDKKPEEADPSDKIESTDKEEKHAVSRPRIDGKKVKEVIGRIALYSLPWLFIIGGVPLAVLLLLNEGFQHGMSVFSDGLSDFLDDMYGFSGELHSPIRSCASSSSFLLGILAELLGGGVACVLGERFEPESTYVTVVITVCVILTLCMFVAFCVWFIISC